MKDNYTLRAAAGKLIILLFPFFKIICFTKVYNLQHILKIQYGNCINNYIFDL